MADKKVWEVKATVTREELFLISGESLTDAVNNYSEIFNDLTATVFHVNSITQKTLVRPTFIRLGEQDNNSGIDL